MVMEPPALTGRLPADYPGLVALYRLDGDGYDEISQTSGTIYTGVTETNKAVDGTAMSFNRVDNNTRIDTVNSTLLHGETDATIMAWAYARSLAGDRSTIIIPKGGSPLLAILGRTSGTKWQCYMRSAVNAPDNSFETGKWVWLVGTLEGQNGSSKAVFYIDGVSVGDTTTAGTYAIDQSVIFEIGRYDNFASASRFDGIIDEVAIFNRTLSATEIAEIYNDIYGGGPE